MNRNYLQVIDGLSNLNLSSYPYSEARNLIGQLSKFGCILLTLHKGAILLRARPNLQNETFSSKCQLTYKPQQFNKTFQRASTPNKTMFYGSFLPDKLEKGELKNARVIAAFETLPLLRDKSLLGIHKVTFGHWEVKQDIKLIAIVQHENFYRESSYTREIVERFKKNTIDHPQLKQETIAVSDFFAKEFAKEDTLHDYDYLLSACFTETIVDRGIDGVLYPSVRIGGKGFNVAIRPETADTSLELLYVEECLIYKNKERSFADNLTLTKLAPNQSSFKLLPIDPKFQLGEAMSLQRIGVSSIDELLNP